MKILALLFIFIAAIGSLSGQSVKITTGEWNDIPKETRKNGISRFISRYGDYYIVRGDEYAVIDKNLNIIHKVEAPEMFVQYEFVNGNKLHLIGCKKDKFYGDIIEIYHSYLDLDKMEFSEPQILVTQRVLAESKGKRSKLLKKDDLQKFLKYDGELKNFNRMLVKSSPNKNYILIATYYNPNYNTYSCAHCYNLMLFDRNMNKLAEQEMIDTFLVRYDQIDSNKTDQFNNGQLYYFFPRRYTTLDVSVNDDGLVTAIRSRKQLHKISGSEFAVSLLYPDGKYQYIDLGKIMGDENMDRPEILKCDGKKLLFYGYYTRPDEYYYNTHRCSYYAIGTYKVDLESHDVKMVDRKEYNEPLFYCIHFYYYSGFSQDHWKLDSGWVTELSRTMFNHSTSSYEAFWDIKANFASLDNDGKIRKTQYDGDIPIARFPLDRVYSTIELRKHPMVHGNYMFHFPETLNKLFTIDYLCSGGEVDIDFNPYSFCKKNESIPVFFGDSILIRDKKNHYCWGKIEITD